MRRDVPAGRLGGAVRSTQLGLVVAASLVGSAGIANADAGDVNASDCLTGDAENRDLVAESDLGWFTTISLYCGDISKGVIHISQNHDIDEGGADDENVVACMDGILYYGEEDVASSEDNLMYVAKLSDGRIAKLVWDEETNEVVTMYVEGDVSNDWAACAETVGA